MENKREESPKRWRWWHGVIFYGIVQALSFGLGKLAEQTQRKSKTQLAASLVGSADDNAFYNRLKQPSFAPPDWSFAPVWTINNAICIWGLLHVLNLKKDVPGRTGFLVTQGVVWVSFLSFNPLYFGFRSPINGAIDTNISLVATLATAYYAIFKMKDTKAALSQSTILPWLIVAAGTANTVALWNKDDFYGVKPVIKDTTALVK